MTVQIDTIETVQAPTDTGALPIALWRRYVTPGELLQWSGNPILRLGAVVLPLCLWRQPPGTRVCRTYPFLTAKPDRETVLFIPSAHLCFRCSLVVKGVRAITTL